MVYQLNPSEIRHHSTPLRLPQNSINQFVESQTLCCSHYDAFRFFTPQASPKNTLHPTHANRPQLEQAGCLHANMDLFKWSYKLWPHIGSSLVGETFQLAAQARSLDMRASPYNLQHLGFNPIPIETPQGRITYLEEQQAIASTATNLRKKLLNSAQNLANLNLPA